MWRNYMLVAIRSLTNSRGYAAINIAGLAIGLAACLLLLLYVRYEASWDKSLPEHERVFQVQATWHEAGQPVTHSQGSPFPVRQTLAGGFPQIEALTVYRTGPAPVVRNAEPIFLNSASVDPSFFQIFQLPFRYGSPATALADMRSVVLTESEARAQFGRADVLGRTLSIGAGPGKQDYRIGGVLADLPKQSSLRFGILFRNDPAMFDQAPESARGWGAMSQAHFVLLRRPEDVAAINAALPAWEKRVVAPQVIGGKPTSQADIMSLKLTPIADVHLGEAQQGALAPGGDPGTLATFTLIAALTLAMAVMNFVNLSTARGLGRAREIAMRRLLGATRPQLVAQMLVESLLTTACALLLALALVELATPWVARATGAELSAHYLGPDGMLLPAIGLFLVAGAAGGLYPALYLSRLRPASVLRANRSATDTPGGGRLRVALIVLQFAAAIGLVASTWIIQQQTHFLATLDPGYRRDGLIQVNSAWRFAGDDAEFQAARAELARLPGVVAAGRTNLALAATNRSLISARALRNPDDLSIGTYAVDPGFFAAMEIKLLAGRLPDDAHGNDRVLRDDKDRKVKGNTANVVVNEAAARLLELGSADQAVGRTFKLGLGEDLIPATVIGVVGDTRIRTPRDPLEPIVYVYDPSQTSQVLVRYAGANPAQVMAGVKKVWRRFEPEIPFDARFAEDILAETYAAESARGMLFAGFSIIAIAIACLGLFGLASFTTRRRTKEIGIRKMLGARIRDIVRLLAWQFSKPVILANVVAWPVAWWAMRDWLNTFDARIPLGPGPFLLAGLIALAIAIGTVAGHAFRVARLNPIHALRYE